MYSIDTCTSFRLTYVAIRDYVSEIPWHIVKPSIKFMIAVVSMFSGAKLVYLSKKVLYERVPHRETSKGLLTRLEKECMFLRIIKHN
jgi:hypothetical protein